LTSFGAHAADTTSARTLDFVVKKASNSRPAFSVEIPTPQSVTLGRDIEFAPVDLRGAERFRAAFEPLTGITHIACTAGAREARAGRRPAWRVAARGGGTF
jgi:hypothetical protein